MERKEFLKKTCQMGLCLPVVSALPDFANIIDDDKKNTNFTPCEEKTDFARDWIKRFMRQLDENIDEETRIKLMRSCGKACYRGANGEKKKDNDGKNWKEHLDGFVKVYENYAGKGFIFVEGSKVNFKYSRNPRGLKISDGYCLCPLVEDGPKDLSFTYCYCSEGYVKEMFTDIVGKEVQVELKKSLRRGDKECAFEITII